MNLDENETLELQLSVPVKITPAERLGYEESLKMICFNSILPA